MTKQEIVNYVCETPGNTNPAVLSSMLNEFGPKECYYINTDKILGNNGFFRAPHELIGKINLICKGFGDFTTRLCCGTLAYSSSIGGINQVIGMGSCDNNYMYFGGSTDDLYGSVSFYWRPELEMFEINRVYMRGQDVTSQIISLPDLYINLTLVCPIASE